MFIKSVQIGPTYCILTVLILKALQVNLAISIVVQLMRLAFIFLGGHFEEIVLLGSQYWMYYGY
jgi:hypothetical protein